MNRAIFIPRPLSLAGLLLLCGCLYHPERQIDEYVANMMAHPYDVAPPSPPLAARPEPAKPQAAIPVSPMDVRTTALMEAPKDEKPEDVRRRLKVPEAIPGSETLPIELPKDFAPIGFITLQPMFIAVSPKIGVKSLPELIALAKKKPGELSYATTGRGRITHLTMELIQERVSASRPIKER